MRTGKAEETLKAIDASQAAIMESQNELSRRAQEEREALEAIPINQHRNREMDKRRSRAHPVNGAPFNYVKKRAHPELEGVTLDASRLTREEGEELAAIVKRFRELPEGVEPPAAEVARYEELVGRWAGDDHLFENKRREAEVEARMAEIQDEERVAALEPRPLYAEKGSVTLPRLTFEWLRDSRGDGWQIGDTAMLVAVLQMFENRTSLLANSDFEEEDGELVLVVRGGTSEVRFLPGKNGNAVDSTGSGVIREREALRCSRATAGSRRRRRGRPSRSGSACTRSRPAREQRRPRELAGGRRGLGRNPHQEPKA